MKLLAALAAAWAGVITWVALDHPYGIRFAMGIWPVPPGTPWTYQLESGFVPALTVLTLLSALVSAFHLKNCHWQRCWRLGKHQVNGSPYCTRHVSLVTPERTIEQRLADISQAAEDQLALLRRLIDLLEHPPVILTVHQQPPGGGQ